MNNKQQKINNKQRGFTLAEVLVVIGMISILLSIGSVGILNYQRVLKLVELDTTAKEIFIVAQNYMIRAKATGKWEALKISHEENKNTYFGQTMLKKPSDYPTEETWPENSKTNEHRYRYITYSKAGESQGQTLLDEILPYGSIEEEVRKEGQYIIEYDYETGTIYSVFYTDSKQTLDYDTDIMGPNGLDLNKGRENSSEGKKVRRNYKNAGGQMTIGYYGGAVTNELEITELHSLDMKIENGEDLKLIIEEEQSREAIGGKIIQTHLMVTVTGEESGVSEEIRLQQADEISSRISTDSNWYEKKMEGDKAIHTLILDSAGSKDIRFAEIFPNLIPGENIIIEVEQISDEALVKTEKVSAYTNSLFEDKIKLSDIEAKAIIKNRRHLRNLNGNISKIPSELTEEKNIGNIITHAEQIEHIDLAGDNFQGIEHKALKVYEGNDYALRNFNLLPNEGGHYVGLFAQVGGLEQEQNLTVTNLKLENFQAHVNQGSVGTLVGSVQKGELVAQNIIVTSPTVKAGNQGYAGGLIGEASGRLQVNQIAITDPTVKAGNQGYAGGLVGKMQEGTVTNSGVYLTDQETDSASKYKSGAYNLETNKQGEQFSIHSEQGVAGGLIGKIEKDTTLNNCFSALPVSDGQNGVAGGLVGKIEENIQVAISNTYTSGYTEEGKYTSYYSVAAQGTSGIAGGLIGQDSNKNTKITNSYSTASVYGNTAGGFIGVSEGTDLNYKDCYVTGKVIGTDSFIGKLSNGSLQVAEGCYYLSQSNPDLKNTQKGVLGVNYDELAQMTEPSKGITMYYDTKRINKNYPFKIVMETGSQEDIIHYGDWPEKEEVMDEISGDIGVLYYEIIDDKLYYHGYFGEFSSNESKPNYKEVKTEGEGLVNGLTTDINKFVSEEGYLIAVPEHTDLSKIVVEYGDKQNINTGERWTLLSCVETFNKRELITIEGYEVYYFSKEINMYNQPYLIMGETVNQWYPTLGEERVSFIFNPYFAEGVKIKEMTTQQFHIRSVRHLLSMTELRNSYSDKENVEYIQSLDINYKDTMFTRNGQQVTYKYKTLDQIHADYTVIDSGDSTRDYGYMIKGLEVPLFGTIEETATIKGVTLINSEVTGEWGTGGFANTNEGIIENCSVRPENLNINNNHSVWVKGSGSVAGFVHTNRGGSIKNCYFIGQVEGITASGFIDTIEKNDQNPTSVGSIENSYADATVKGIESAYGFGNYNNNGIIKDCHFRGTVTGKKAVGFIETNQGTIKKAYVEATIEGAMSGMITDPYNIIIVSSGFTRNNSGTIKNAYFTGTVKGQTVGGFVGANSGAIEDAYVEATVEGAIDGIALDPNNMISVSSGFAFNTSGTIKNAYFAGTVRGQVVGGFAGTNTGTIESCNVHIQVPGENGYNAIVVEGTDQGAGFVHTNGENGLIKHSYFVGTVKGKNTGGFAYKNRSTIKNCYTNVVLTGIESASGFVHEHSNGTIKNSFVTGWVNATGSNSIANGFMQKSGWVTLENCYTALFELSGSKIYHFGRGEEYNYNYKECFWLEDTYTEGVVQEGIIDNLKNVGSSKSYDEMTQTIESNRPTTYPYSKSLEGKKYPFIWFNSGDSSMEFWGDWPLKGKDVGVLYYEILDNKLYYHGYLAEFSNNQIHPNYIEIMTEGDNLSNGLITTPNQYVSEDGYLILVRTGKSLDEIAIALSDQIRKLSDCVEPFIRKDLISLKGFDIYYFTQEAWMNGFTDIRIGRNMSKEMPQIVDYAMFAFNPYFADTVKTTSMIEGVRSIRSARQLLNMSNQVDESDASVQYLQKLDISYIDTKFTKNGVEHNYDYQPMNSMSNQYKALEAKEGERGYVIKGLKTPLFGTIESDITIEDVTLINSCIEGMGNIAGFANVNKGTIKNCSFEGSVQGEIVSGFVGTNTGVIERCYVRAQVPDDKGYSAVRIEGSNQSAGFVEYNNEGGTIKDSYFVGTVIGDEAIGFTNINKGNITSCYANVDLQATTIGAGFLNSNWGAVENCFSVGWVKSKGSAFGFIHRDETQSVLKDSYAALFKLEGTKTCGFGTGKGASYKDCFYLESAVNPKTEQKGNLNGLKVQGTVKSYDDMKNIGTKPQTFPYSDNLKEQLYPFKIISTDATLIPLEFWGDWPTQ